MPLIHSNSESAKERNIKTLIHDGYPPRQAVAIAYSIQRGAPKRCMGPGCRHRRKSSHRSRV